MKRLFLIPLLCLALFSCSEKGYDPVEAQQLCNEFRIYHSLDHKQIDHLLTQESYALSEIKEKLQDLNDISDADKFNKSYTELKNDTSFVSMVSMSELMWRVLVLSQNKFSDSNLEKFKTVNECRRIVDLLNDELLLRVYAPEKTAQADNDPQNK